MRYNYDITVIGGGAAGLVAATAAAALGAKTALIENNKLGGDCTWYGCVPSKALLKSASVLSLTRRLKEFGILASGDVKYDTSEIMSHVQDVVKKISEHHPAEVFQKRGIEVLFGSPRFIDNRTIEFKGARITSKRFIVCPGSLPMIPSIVGIKSVEYITNQSIFKLEELPRSLIVLGGGPIGVEISQAFSRLGVEVSIIEMMDRVLFREDKEAAQVLTDRLIKDGVSIYTGKKAVRLSREGDLAHVTVEDKNGQQSMLKAEQLLVAVGRVPNIIDLRLEKAKIKYNDKRIVVDKTLRTSASNIYACGDVVGHYQFSHMAEYQAIIAVSNALFPFKRKVDYSCVPWCTFTDPEVAHLGPTEEEAKLRYRDIKIYRSNYRENDRAVTDVEAEGFAKIICDSKGNILGAHIVGANAGELIHEYILAKTKKLKIGDLSSTIHIYPTLAQIAKRTGDQYYLQMLSSNRLKKLFKFFIKMM
ncbi:dihydrolipoyl dehydrogenase family protein [Candidatus Omnitrophota bacterium]